MLMVEIWVVLIYGPFAFKKMALGAKQAKKPNDLSEFPVSDLKSVLYCIVCIKKIVLKQSIFQSILDHPDT